MATMDWSDQRGSAPASYEEFLVPAMFAPFAERLVEQAGVSRDHGCSTSLAAPARFRAPPRGGPARADR
jgi:hypothetical protein